jgi:hypothetical protein
MATDHWPSPMFSGMVQKKEPVFAIESAQVSLATGMRRDALE